MSSFDNHSNESNVVKLDLIRHGEASEKLSAMMDGELPANEYEAILAQPEAAERWGRYHVLRDCLQDETPLFLHTDIAADVAAAIEQESTSIRRSASTQARWQLFGGAALAASVFGAVIGGWLWLQQPGAAAVSATASALPLNAAQPVAAVLADDEQRRLEELLINHTEAVSANGLQVMLPYARVVSDRVVLPVEEDEKVEAKNAATEESPR